MSQQSDSLESVPLDTLERIDQICERFEAHWSSGAVPSLAEYLAQAPMAGREALLEELLSLDREYRGRRGEALSFDDYARQLPEDVDALRALWGDTEEAGDRPAKSEHAANAAVRQLGDYELHRELGRGGMGVVYEARQISLNRLVALKMIRDSEFASGHELFRFQNEAKVVATLDHANIVPIIEVGNLEGQHWFSMKLVAGGSLAQRLGEYTAQPPAAAALLVTVAEAVHYAHQRGILHRDLKPANILIDEQGRPHVTDFGLARRIDDDNELSVSGRVAGTPSYMAPEQTLGKSGSTTTATDVYGLGTVLYALLTGRAPFAGDTPFHTIEQLRDRAPDRPRAHNPRVPRDLELICLKCLEKDPKWRYPSASALAEDLRSWQAGKPIAARPVGPLSRAWMWCKRKPVPAGLLASLVVALAGGFAGVAKEWRRAEANLSLLKSANAELTSANHSLEKARDKVRQDLYGTEMNLIRQLADSEFGSDRVEDLLAHWYPRAAEPDRRHWEWYHLFGSKRRGLRTWEVPERRPICSVSWSADGRRLASVIDDGSLVVWDPNTGHEIATLRGHARGCPVSVWSPDGRHLLSAGDATIKVWSAETWRETASLGTAEIFSILRLSPDGHRLASGDSRGLALWDAGTGKRIAALSGKCASISWDPDSRRLATTSLDGTITLWDANAREETAALRGHTRTVAALAWSRDGHRLASGSEDRSVRLWDTVAARPITTLNGHTDEVLAVAWSPDGHRLASAGRDRIIKLWNADSGEQLATLYGNHNEVYTLAWSPEGRRLASAGFEGRVKLWDVEGRLEALHGHAGAVSALCWSSDDRRLASAALDHSIRLWDAETGREIATLRGHTNGVEGLSWSPDDRRLASGSRDGRIKLWDASTGREIATLNRIALPVSSVSWSHDGRRLAFCGHGKSVHIWDAVDGRETANLKGHTADVCDVSFSPDGRRLASASQDGTVRLWAMDTGEPIASLRGHTSEAKSVCWSPDGSRLASASLDGTIKLWDARSAELIATLRGHTHWVMSVSWSPDGRRLASASWDHTVKVWDPETGKETASLSGHKERVNVVRWSSDGTRLATGAWDKTVRLWDARPGYARDRAR
jgi:WD40 repeat protein/tRNA A-37 threonylcarbamoyl transferase component Bud32